jgi:tRNA G18 (ribose-2'-O)-methylase SpoU
VSEPDLAREEGLFVAEGTFVVRRLIQQRRFVTRSLLLTQTALHRLSDVLADAPPSLDVFVTSLDVIKGITGFNIHRGCLALGERPAPLDPLETIHSARLLLVLEGVGNPDNVGGVFRNAAAFDVDGVLLGAGCGDPLYRKAIRVSMAAALMVPFASVARWPGDLEEVRRRGFRIVALTPHAAAADLASFASTYPAEERLALLVGAEGDGLSDAVMALADARVRIPTSSRVDSLNVATATGIALHRLAAATRTAQIR